MVKLFIGLISIVICTVVGKSITDKYCHKKLYFEYFKDFNQKLKQNLTYKRESMIKMLDFDCKNEYLNDTLKSFKTYLFYGKNVDDIYFPPFLEDEEIKIFKDYFETIGKNSAVSELEFIKYFDDKLNEKLLKIRDKINKFSTLGQKIGFSVGLAVCILIL